MNRDTIAAVLSFGCAVSMSACREEPPVDPCADCRSYPLVEPTPVPCEGGACADGEAGVDSGAEGGASSSVDGATAQEDRGLGCFIENGAALMCTSRCHSSADCYSGHSCVEDEGIALCTPRCDSSLCASGSECTEICGACQRVTCGVVVPCPNPSDVCSVEQHDCFPGSGACGATGDCPHLHVFEIPPTSCGSSSRQSVYGAVACVNMQCSWQRAPISIGISGASIIDVIQPSTTTTYNNQNQIVFKWAPTGTPVILFVLNGIPDDLSNATNFVIWGDVVADISVSSVSWNMGQAVTSDGVWQPGVPTAVTSQALYLLVEAVRGGKVVGLSNLIPFAVGAWPEVGDACSSTGSLPDKCDNPGRSPQMCSNGVCRRLCASDGDCPTGSTCGSASAYGGGSVRICS
jgi:hypothetical protein